MNESEATRPIRRVSTRIRVFLVVLLVVASLTATKAILFPEHPTSWYRIHDTRDLPLSEVRDILATSGSTLVSTVSESGSSTETWRHQHHFGAWTVFVHIWSSPSGDQFSGAHVRYDSTVFPHLTRMRNYPNP